MLPWKKNKDVNIGKNVTKSGTDSIGLERIMTISSSPANTDMPKTLLIKGFVEVQDSIVSHNKEI